MGDGMKGVVDKGEGVDLLRSNLAGSRRADHQKPLSERHVMDVEREQIRKMLECRKTPRWEAECPNYSRLISPFGKGEENLFSVRGPSKERRIGIGAGAVHGLN